MRIQGDLLSAIKLHIVLQRSICWKLSVGTLCLTFELVVKTFPICGLKKSFFGVFSAKSNIKPISIHLKDLYGHMTYGLSEIFVGNAILRTLFLTIRNRIGVINMFAKHYSLFIWNFAFLFPTHKTDLFTISNVNTKTKIRGHMMAYKCLCKCM